MSMDYPPTAGYQLPADVDLSPWMKITNKVPGDSQPFTVDFYLYVNTLPSADGGVFATKALTGSSTSNGFKFFLRTTADAQFAFNLDSSQLHAGNITTGTWTHVACVFDVSVIELYVDGVSLGTVSKTSSNPPGENYIHSKYTTTDVPPPDAEVANLRIWDHARNATQVATDKDTDYPADEPGLLAAYRLDGSDPVEESIVDYGGVAYLIGNGGYDESRVVENNPGYAPIERLDGNPYRSGTVPFSGGEEERPDYQGQISGVVTVKGDPASQRVMALVRSTGQKVAETTSAEDGTYTLTGLDPDVAHVIVALDKNLEYNGVIADNITPEVPA